MRKVKVTVYGEGGFKKSRADKNIVEEYEVEVPDEPIDQRDQEIADLKARIEQLEKKVK